MICKICSNSENNKQFQIKEMYFGFRDEFTYFECSSCGCLQIAQIPVNMGKYYAQGYGPFQQQPPRNFLIRFLQNSRNRYEVFHKGYLGKLLSRRYPNDFLKIVAKSGINLESRILDVGCGSGQLLHHLRNAGAKNLLGIDPYVEREIVEDEFKILHRTIQDLPNDQEFDLIMFHHSLEHIPDQLETINKVYPILARNGVCLIRIPLKTEYLWNLYGINCFFIDAPRHFFLHTLKSFDLLVSKTGLLVKDIIFDSSEFQFLGSEKYKRDIPYMASPRGFAKSLFTQKEIDEFRQTSLELNKTCQGSQAAFYLSK